MKIKIDMFYVSIELIYGKKKFKQAIKKRKLKINMKDYITLDGVCIEDNSDNNNLIIFIDENLNEIESMKTLVHEASHAVTSIMKSRDIDDDETRSYMLDHIFGIFYEYIKLQISMK